LSLEAPERTFKGFIFSDKNSRHKQSLLTGEMDSSVGNTNFRAVLREETIESEAGTVPNPSDSPWIKSACMHSRSDVQYYMVQQGLVGSRATGRCGTATQVQSHVPDFPEGMTIIPMHTTSLQHLVSPR
jgi:hypothetical protein